MHGDTEIGKVGNCLEARGATPTHNLLACATGPMERVDSVHFSGPKGSRDQGSYMSGLAAMGNSLAKAAAVDFGVQWCCWVLAAALKTEKFYDLTGSGKTSLCVNRVEFAPSVQYFFAVFACLPVCQCVCVCVCVGVECARARV